MDAQTKTKATLQHRALQLYVNGQAAQTVHQGQGFECTS